MAATAYMTETEAAAYLTELGVQTSPRTLQKQRVTGGGIPFVKLTTRVRYRKTDIDNWLENLPVLTSTSEMK